MYDLFWRHHQTKLFVIAIFFPQESIGGVGRQYKTKKASIKERYKVAQHLHERLKRVVDDVSRNFYARILVVVV